MLWVALAGFARGFIGSMPVAGPVAVLVVSRSLEGRLRDGALIGLGSALAEGAYAFLAYRADLATSQLEVASGRLTERVTQLQLEVTDVSTRRANEFLDRFVEAIEAHGLECRDGRHEWDFRVIRADHTRPNAAHRDAVVAWLKSRKELARFAVEDLA